GQRLTHTEIFAFLKLLFPAGADTTYLGLGSTIYALLKNPDQLARVVAEPERLCAAAAEEGVRWSPPVPLLPRRNRNDVVWNGVAVPAGATLVFGMGAGIRAPGGLPCR